MNDVPEEHKEAYAEMCRQFNAAVVELFVDSKDITIMRDMPTSLQQNAFIVGAMTGALVPLVAITKVSDQHIVEVMQAAMPDIVGQARKLVDSFLAERKGQATK